MEQPTWIKSEMICSCGCGRKFNPVYRNGILVSKLHPNCRLKSLYREFNTKGIVFASEINSSKQRPEKRQKTPRQKWMDNADIWFSRYVRIINRVTVDNGDVICRCIISGKIYSANNIDNGHCFSRDCKSTRYEPNNCRPQNGSSNRFRGEADHYRFIDNLKDEIGEDEFNRIEQLRRVSVNDSVLWYKEQSDKYRKLVNEEVKKYGINKWW